MINLLFLELDTHDLNYAFSLTSAKLNHSVFSS